MTYSIVVLVIEILFAFACYSVARSKGHSPVLWGVLGFLFGLIALIIVALLPRRVARY